MKYLPLLVLGLMATPAFADDFNVKAMPIPNESTAMPWRDAVCLAKGDLMVKQTCWQGAPKLILVDDVNVSVKPLLNATAYTTPVDLSCQIQPDASLSDCQMAEGAKVSKEDADKAIKMVDGKWHLTGAFVAGKSTRITVMLYRNDGSVLMPIR